MKIHGNTKKSSPLLRVTLDRLRERKTGVNKPSRQTQASPVECELQVSLRAVQVQGRLRAQNVLSQLSKRVGSQSKRKMSILF